VAGLRSSTRFGACRTRLLCGCSENGAHTDQFIREGSALHDLISGDALLLRDPEGGPAWLLGVVSGDDSAVMVVGSRGLLGSL